MEYYDIQRHWTKRIMPHLGDPELNRVLVEDFNKFTFGRWEQKFGPGDKPHEFESCDWWCGHIGPMPRYWWYVKHAACHWLVNFNLRLAMLVEPKRTWHIVTADAHSTVWDGAETLFDLNFLALGVPPDEAFALANQEHLPPGEYLVTAFADPYWFDHLTPLFTRIKQSPPEAAAWFAALPPADKTWLEGWLVKYGKLKGYPFVDQLRQLKFVP